MVESRWHPAAHLPHLRWHEWAGERFLFDPFSGETHVLNAIAAAILDLLNAGPQDEAEILAQLSGGFTPEERANLAVALPTHLALLGEMGLVLGPGEEVPDLYDPSGCPA